MNIIQFKDQLEALTPDDWEKLYQGDVLEMVADTTVRVSQTETPYTIFTHDAFDAESATILKDRVIKNAEDILQRYYRIHPLTEEGFNTQAESLFEQYGASSFAALLGQRAGHSLFVDQGEVIAVTSKDPRHPYGVYKELDKTHAGAKIDEIVQTWLKTGQAYKDYRGMNVCRYNC